MAHGQPSAPGPAEALLAELARKVGTHLPGWRVRSATLAAPGAVERALEKAATPPIVYPLFMATGWFTSQALPARLRLGADRVLAPLGLDPSLPSLALRLLQEQADARGWALAETDILVSAHGSARGSAPAQCARVFAGALSRLAPLGRVRVGFLEEAPRLADVAAECSPQSICLPYFAAVGEHVTEDVPEALAAGGFEGALLPSLGQSEGVPGLIAASLETVAQGRACA